MRILLACSLLAGFFITGFGKSSKNAWLDTLETLEIPAYALNQDADVVVLMDYMEVSLDRRGNIIRTITQAYKILDPEGSDYGLAKVEYTDDVQKVTEFNAWTITPKGKLIKYGKRDVYDAIDTEESQLTTSSRFKAINAKGDLVVGSIFAYQATVVDKGDFLTNIWYFETDVPSIHSRIQFTLPEDWGVETEFFNMQPMAAVTSGNTHTWELRNLEARKPQPLGPDSSEFLKWAVYELIPSADSKRQPSANSWAEISKNKTHIFESQSRVSADMKQTVAEIVDANETKMDKVRALARIAQDVNYISISLDLGRGGGYIPRPSDEVYHSNYGDCKDKTNLLISLLKDAGIQAYPLIVHTSTSRKRIQDHWPSSLQFNHCVTAIEVGNEVNYGVEVDHNPLGRLLIFDPTDSQTALGDLSQYLQGVKGILLAGENGGLIELPALPISKSKMKRSHVVEVDAFGEAVGKIVETSTGQTASKERAFATQRKSDYRSFLNEWILEFHAGAKVVDHEFEDQFQNHQFQLALNYGAPSFAKNIGRGALLIFKPISIDRYADNPFGDEERLQPVNLIEKNLEEETIIKYPVGYDISETPSNLKINEAFGSYSFKIVVDTSKREIQVIRKMQLNDQRVSVADFPVLKAFYERIIRTEQEPLVIERI